MRNIGKGQTAGLAAATRHIPAPLVSRLCFIRVFVVAVVVYCRRRRCRRFYAYPLKRRTTAFRVDSCRCGSRRCRRRVRRALPAVQAMVVGLRVFHPGPVTPPVWPQAKCQGNLDSGLLGAKSAQC